MTAHTHFLFAIESYLWGISLTPAPDIIGDEEPSTPSDLPAVVLSLTEMTSKGSGLGRRSATIENGILPWKSEMDLANPVLPEEPSFSLLSLDRHLLTLPHGGLVRRDGTKGTLSYVDLAVTVAGISRPVVIGAPADDQVSAEPSVGVLTFATPLPAEGIVEVAYFLGSWEQQVERISGILSVDIYEKDLDDLRSLASSVLRALSTRPATAGIQQLLAINVAGIGTISPKIAELGNARRQALRFSFTYDDEINQPDSSGGIIGRVPVVTQVNAVNVDKKTGVIETSIIIESDLKQSP